MTSQITESMQVADSAEPDLSSIPWLDFSGSPDESVGTFIKSVQRVALMKQRTHQDQWIAHYAAGCFDNDALIWYSDLDEDTCNSWRKLRKALLERYHPMARESGSQAAARIFRPSDLQVRAPAVQRVEPPSASTPAMRGRVEVFRYEYPESLGYLSSGCLLSISFRSFSIVVKDQNQGLIVSFPQDSQESPFDLSRTDNQMYGLGMSSQDGYLVLRLLPTDNFNDRVRASAFCHQKEGEALGKSKIATWTLDMVAESSREPRYRRMVKEDKSSRASSRVWKYDKITSELTLTWMRDNDVEEDIAAFMQTGDDNYLHFHRLTDWAKAEGLLDEYRVKLHFVPERNEEEPNGPESEE